MQYPSGAAKCDYHLVEGIWYDYERLWHTGQLIGGLLAVSTTLNSTQWLPAAKAAGDWMVAQTISSPKSLRGLLNSTDVVNNGHGCITDACAGVQVMSDVGDANGPLFELSKRTGDGSYAAAATMSARWYVANMAVPGHPGLYYAAINKTSSPPHPFLPSSGSDYGYTLSDIEGSLLLHACGGGKIPAFCAAFTAQADATVRAQGAHGLWLQWPPNDAATGRFHPRFNLWYASSLIDAHDHTSGGEAAATQRIASGQYAPSSSYLEAAALTASTYAAVQERDGTFWYWNAVNASTGVFSKVESDVCGSATAFLAMVCMRLLQRGAGDPSLLRPVVARSVDWLLVNQFSTRHPDANLRGAYLELDFRKLAKTSLTTSVA